MLLAIRQNYELPNFLLKHHIQNLEGEILLLNDPVNQDGK